MKNSPQMYYSMDSLSYPALAADEKYHILIRHSLHAFFVIQPDGRFEECNDTACNLFGYNSSEFKHLNAQDIIHTDPPLTALRHGGESEFLKLSATAVKKTGELFTVAVIIAAFINTQGHLRYSILVNDNNDQYNAVKDIRQVLDSITDGFFTLDDQQVVQYWNNGAEKITGIHKENITGQPFSNFYTHAKRMASFIRYNQGLHDKLSAHFEEYYEAINKWLDINIYPSGTGLSVLFKDITETRRLRELERIEKQVLENNARANSELQVTLHYYLKEIEKIHPGMICSVLRFKDNRLYNWASPSLPERYCTAIEGVEIGDNVGSCGTAAFKKQKVIVTDIEHDTRWTDFKAFALQEGLKACWSFPVLDLKDEVLGTFAVYYKEIKTPTKEEEKTLERARNLLLVIMENKIAEASMRNSIVETQRTESLLKTSVENYRYLFNNNPSSILIWDIETLAIIEVNETAIALYGYAREEFLQLSILDIYPEPERNIFSELVLESREPNIFKRSMRWQQVNKRGAVLITETTSHIITYNGNKVVLSLTSNVTEKVLLENSLTEERKIRQQQITDAVITGQEKERTELGQELHDNINQILATVKLYLECALEQKQFRPQLVKESKLLTEKAMQEIRHLSNTLIPPSLEEIGLLEALNDLTGTLRSAHPLKIIDNWKGFPEMLVHKKLKLTIFRIVQEQLNNIVKHAKATQVKISISRKEGNVYLEIEDNGVGFDTTQKRGGVGLKNIISRSEVNNGKVNIRSKPGQGCTIAVCFAAPGA
ncbi:sensor histidine kinase [Ferruginibacter sp.]